MGREKIRVIKQFFLVVIVLILDVFTKGYIRETMILGDSFPVIRGFFNISYVQNRGAAWGMGANLHDSIREPLFLFIPVLACIWLAWLIWNSRRGPRLDGLAYSLILSGAIGNLIDRFSLGYVVDFFDFHIAGSHFPAFNIADSAISIAAGLLVWNFIVMMFNKSKLDKDPYDTKKG